MHRWPILLTRLLLTLGLLVSLAAMPTAAQRAEPAVSLSLQPLQAPPGATITVRGEGWPAGSMVTVSFGRSDENLDRWLVDWVKSRVANDGRLELSLTVPYYYGTLNGQWLQVTPGRHDLVVTTLNGADGAATSASTSLTVIAEGPLPERPAIYWRFREHYYSHDGGRLLGLPLTEVVLEANRQAQYFEKGRLEDHTGADGAPRLLYGRLAAELADVEADRPVGGDSSSVTYATLHTLAAPERREAPPAGWERVGSAREDGAVFVPVDSALRPAPGHWVPARFWEYLNRSELFPSGWLNDVGLPLTPAITARVVKIVNGTPTERTITVQLFERTVLTDDPENPAGYHIERANVGSDYRRVATGPLVPGDAVLHPAYRWSAPRQTEADLPEGLRGPAWEWLAEYSAGPPSESEIAALQRQLTAEGWSVQPGQPGSGGAGRLVAVRENRLQVIAWWLGLRPVTPPEQPERGTRLRVLIGERRPVG